MTCGNSFFNQASLVCGVVMLRFQQASFVCGAVMLRFSLGVLCLGDQYSQNLLHLRCFRAAIRTQGSVFTAGAGRKTRVQRFGVGVPHLYVVFHVFAPPPFIEKSKKGHNKTVNHSTDGLIPGFIFFCNGVARNRSSGVSEHLIKFYKFNIFRLLSCKPCS